MRPDPLLPPDWTAPAAFAARWQTLAGDVGLAPDEPLLIALSGGADSVLLLTLAACARPRPRIVALHVDHGLRSEESRADARACVTLCQRLGVPLVVKRFELDPRAPDLEARARRARYAALAEEARRSGIRCIATGHHADDALETLLMRWLRGSELLGLAGPPARGPLPTPGGGGLFVVRPLLALSRSEVRTELERAGVRWREDASNQSPRFTRNRVRAALLPQIDAACGPEARDNLRAFAAAVGGLELELDTRTRHLAWQPAPYAPAAPGGTLERSALEALAPTLRRRALWRLVGEATGERPPRAVLDLFVADLELGRSRRHALGGGWTLELRARRLHLSPPAPSAPLSDPTPGVQQLRFPYAGEQDAPEGAALGLPGRVALPDGREITAELTTPPPGSAVPRGALEVELDAGELGGELSVRWPRAGDRFHALGAPGSRPLSRFLADAGVPLAERARVPLVFIGRELVWVAGIRPAEARRVRRRTARRLHLVLQGNDAAPEPSTCSGRAGSPGLFDA